MSTPNAAELFADAYRDPKHDSFTLPGDRGGALLIHGFPGTPADMRPLAAALNGEGWAIRAPLLPGFGREIATLAEKTVADWTCAVTAEFRALQREHERTLILGHSMGGALALIAAGAHQPDQLILLAPFWKIEHPLWKLLPALRFVFPSFKPFSLMKIDFDDPEARKGIAGIMPAADLGDPQVQEAVRNFSIPTNMLYQLRRVGWAGHDAAPEVRARTLVLQGTKDSLVTPELTQTLMNRLPTPVRYVEVNGGHALVEDDKSAWAAVKAAVLDFAAADR
jgi:carboxylesterase